MKTSKLLLALAIGGILTACGGGGSGNVKPSSTAATSSSQAPASSSLAPASSAVSSSITTNSASTASSSSTAATDQQQDVHVNDYAHFIASCRETNCERSEPLAGYLVAHAGGGINAATYTNSLEALDYNYKQGHRLFELDFDITTDNKLAAIHGWEQAEIYGGTKGEPMRLEQFMKASRQDGLTQLDGDMIYRWLEEHPDARIVTDVKSDNIKACKLFLSGGENIKTQVIPQIYTFSQYAEVKNMGYKQVIYTNYVSSRPIDLVFEFAQASGVSAITLPWGVQISAQQAKTVPVYFHTINECYDVSLGISVYGASGGFYTDFLTPDSCNLATEMREMWGLTKKNSKGF